LTVHRVINRRSDPLRRRTLDDWSKAFAKFTVLTDAVVCAARKVAWDYPYTVTPTGRRRTGTAPPGIPPCAGLSRRRNVGPNRGQHVRAAPVQSGPACLPGRYRGLCLDKPAAGNENPRQLVRAAGGFAVSVVRVTVPSS
jgi:hypothetical protein